MMMIIVLCVIRHVFLSQHVPLLSQIWYSGLLLLRTNSKIANHFGVLTCVLKLANSAVIRHKGQLR
jgi:hypothetical protein